MRNTGHEIVDVKVMTTRNIGHGVSDIYWYDLWMEQFSLDNRWKIVTGVGNYIGSNR